MFFLAGAVTLFRGFLAGESVFGLVGAVDLVCCWSSRAESVFGLGVAAVFCPVRAVDLFRIFLVGESVFCGVGAVESEL